MKKIIREKLKSIYFIFFEFNSNFIILGFWLNELIFFTQVDIIM